MTESQFDELIEAAIREYGVEYIEVPEEMRKPHRFSRSFERRMRKMLRQEQGIHYSHRRIPLRQLITIIIAALMVMTAVAMSVSAVRNAVIGFITEVYEKFTDVAAEPEEGAPETLEEIYEVTWVPEGYRLKEEIGNTAVRYQRFRNDVSDEIGFDQYTLSGFSGNFDTEFADMEQIEINGAYGFLILDEYGSMIVWSDEKYVCYIQWSLGLDGMNKSDIIRIAESVQIVESQ